MKRSFGMGLAVALLAVSMITQSVSAQYYRPSNNNNNIGGMIAAGVIGGIVGGVVASTILSNSDSRAMSKAYPRVFDDDIRAGYRAEFEGDGHRGYYEVVNCGRHREYDTCRQIRTVVYDRYGSPVPEYQQRRPRFVCLNTRSNQWIDVDNRDYMVRPSQDTSVRITVRRPQPQIYEQRPMIVQQPVRPYPQQGYAQPMYAPVQQQYGYGAGPAIRPMPQMPAPGVLPAVPQAVR